MLTLEDISPSQETQSEAYPCSAKQTGPHESTAQYLYFHLNCASLRCHPQT